MWHERATTLAIDLESAYVEKIKEPTKERLNALDKINKKLKERKEQLNRGVCVPDITRN